MYRSCRLAAVLLPALIVAVAGALLHPHTAGAAEELETRTLSTYDVGADGGVHVTVAAQVTNRDPSTPRRSSGRVFFYSAAVFVVHDAAVNLTARSGATRLAVDVRERDDPLRVISVRFDRNLYYMEAIEITLEYDLVAVRAAQLLVRPQYAFVPALGQGARSLLRISAPADRELTVGSTHCSRVAEERATYACGASTSVADYQNGGRCAFTAASPRWECAFTDRDLFVIPFEASAADLALSARTADVMLRRGPVQVRVQQFSGEDAWAARVENLTRRGLPLLEEVHGFAYPGPDTIEIVESGYRDTHGYEGLASTRGRLRLTPVVEDQTILHELAHLWSGIFASRWLAEGMAEYAANVVARRLGVKPEVPQEPLPAAPRLEEWGPLRDQIAVSRAEREREEAGYTRSLRFMELLAIRAGASAIPAANSKLAQEQVRGTARTYLDAVEDVTRVQVAPLFGEWALTEADAALLPAREAARQNATTLRERAARLGLSAPADLDHPLRMWEFERAERTIATAAGALEMHEQTLTRAQAGGFDLGNGFGVALAESAEGGATAAREEAAALTAVSAALEQRTLERSPLMRAGLIGDSLGGREAAMRTALAEGDYAAATASAAEFQQRLDSAAQRGGVRGGLAAILLIALAGFALLRRRAGGAHAVAAERAR